MAYNPGYERQMLQYFKNGGSDGMEFPTFAGFAEQIGVTLRQLRTWKEEEPAFALAWDECRERQRARLITGGLTRRYDPTFCKYLLGEISPAEESQAFTVTVEVVE